MNRTARRSTIWLFLIPALLFYLAFVAWPIGQSFYVSLFRWNVISPTPDAFVGFDNYAGLRHDPVFHKALANNLLLVVLSLAVQLPLSLFLAALLSGRVFARSFFRTVFFSPMILPTVVIALVWREIYLSADFGGLAVGLLDAVGFRTPADGFLESPHFSFLAVFATISWRYVGFHMVLFMAGIESISEDLYEAARIDGAGSWQLFRHITLPLLAPVIKISAVLSIVGSLKYFDLVWVLTQGDLAGHATDLMTTYMYRYGIREHHAGYGSAIAVAGFLVSMAIVVPLMLVRSGRSVSSEGRRWRVRDVLAWVVLGAAAVAAAILGWRTAPWIRTVLPYAAVGILCVVLVPLAAVKGLSRFPSLRRYLAATLKYLLLAAFVVVAAYPVFWMLTTSVRSASDVALSSKWALPERVSWDSFAEVLLRRGFHRYLINSVVVTTSAVLLTLTAAALAAYALARLRFRGRATLFFLFLAGMMIPIHIVLIPLLKIFGTLKLETILMLRETTLGYAACDRILAVIEQGSLVVTYVAFSLPISIFILKGFFEGVPAELEEAARIDGCGAGGVFWHVMLPSARPAIAVVVIFNFVTLWNEFVFALTLLRTGELFTIPRGLFAFASTQRGTNYPLLCAALSVAALPMLLVYILAQKHIIRGLTSGALKG